MATVNPSPFGPKPQFELSSGAPAVGNKLFFYVAGSVGTKQTTYTSSTGLVGNTNPIILDALGMPTATEIWFTAGQSYKVVYAPSTDTDPPTSPIWTIDNLLGINDTTSAQTEWIAGPVPTFVSTTSFTLVGDQTTNFHVGRRIKTTNTSGTIYSTIVTSAFAVLTTITVVNDSSVLDAGLSAVSYGLISATNTSEPLLIDTYPIRSGSADKTKKVRLEVDGLTTATTRVITIPDHDFTIGTGYELISVASASASATVDFTTGFTSTYDVYVVTMTDIIPATDGVTLQARISQSASFKSGASDYGWAQGGTTSGGAAFNNGSGADSKLQIASGLSNAATTRSFSGELRFFNPAGTTVSKVITWQNGYLSNAPAFIANSGSGMFVGITSGGGFNQIDGLRFFMSAGNITSGAFALYGVRKS